MSDGPDRFDWEDAECVVIQEQSGIAVYENSGGGIVILERGSYPDDDTYIVIQPSNLRPLIKRLVELCRDYEASQ